MPDRWGRPEASDWLSIGAIGGRMMSAQRDDAIREEEFKWKQEAYEEDKRSNQVLGILNDQGEKADLSGFDPITRAKGIAKFAMLQAEKNRNTKEGIELEKQKMAQSVDRIERIGKEYLVARAMGDTEAAEKAYMNFVHHSRNNIREVQPLNDGKYRLYLLDGTERDIKRPSDEQMDESVKAYLSDPKIHIANKQKEDQFIRENNYKASLNPEIWRNKEGQEIIVKQGFIDPQTRRPMTAYEDANTLQSLTEEQVKRGRFQPVSVAEQRTKFAAQDLLQKKYAIGGAGINQPDYRNAWQGNDGKWYAETLGGTVEIDPSKAKQETMHVLGGLQTNPETGEAQVAVQKGNKITAQTIEGMKVGSKGKDMITIQQPDGTSTAMTRSQAMRELKDLSSMVTVPEAKQSLAALLSGGDTMDESQRTSRIAAISKAASSGTPEERAYAAQALAIAGSLWPSAKASTRYSPVRDMLKRAKEYQTTGLN